MPHLDEEEMITVLLGLLAGGVLSKECLVTSSIGESKAAESRTNLMPHLLD